MTIGVDIKDIPKVSDQDFSITLNAYFNVKWRDPRLLVSSHDRHKVCCKPMGEISSSF